MYISDIPELSITTITDIKNITEEYKIKVEINDKNENIERQKPTSN